MKRKKTPGPSWRKINNKRNSSCASARLDDLDWSNWWVDNSFAISYIHVPHKDKFNGSVHRIFCRYTDTPRIGIYMGEPYWLVDSGAERNKDPLG